MCWFVVVVGVWARVLSETRVLSIVVLSVGADSKGRAQYDTRKRGGDGARDDEEGSVMNSVLNESQTREKGEKRGKELPVVRIPKSRGAVVGLGGICQWEMQHHRVRHLGCNWAGSS